MLSNPGPVYVLKIVEIFIKIKLLEGIPPGILGNNNKNFVKSSDNSNNNNNQNNRREDPILSLIEDRWPIKMVGSSSKGPSDWENHEALPKKKK